MSKEVIILSDEEKRHLKELHLVNKNDSRFCDKIKSILLFSEGYSANQIAKIILIDKSSVYRYKKKYLKSGLNGLLESNS